MATAQRVPTVDDRAYQLFCLPKYRGPEGDPLTDIQQKVYNCLVAGYSLRGAATNCGITLQQATNHRTSIMYKGWDLTVRGK